jgi:hypothetical protein
MKTYRNYKRHSQVFLGWKAYFDNGVNTMEMKVHPKYSSEPAAKARVLEIVPNAQNIELVKIMCED